MKTLTAAVLMMATGAALAQNDSQWNFDGNLNNAFGNGILDYWTPDAENATAFGSASGFGIGSAPDGSDINCASINFTNDLEAFVCLHGAPANGGGAYVNNYTMIWDLYVPQSSFDQGDWLSFYNTNDSNTNDGDAFLYTPDGSWGVGDLGYAGVISPDTWHRYAIVHEVQLDGSVKHSKFIDGTLVGTGTTSLDGRFALYTVDDVDSPWFHVMADNDGDMLPAYIASFYVSDEAWSAADIKALGCVSADGATSAGPDCSNQDQICDTPADFNKDGVVDTRDVLEFLNSWNQGCP